MQADSQDGEWLGLLASALDDANAMCVQAFNSFSPSTAQGVGLSSNVKLNGIARLIPSFSTAPMLIVGQAGTQIVNGIVADVAGNTWALPASVVIPNAGQISVTAVCQTQGAIAAPTATITTIQNTQPGWQTASNTGPATLGAPTETDYQLRARQSQSTMNASTAILEGITGALLALPGVDRVTGYQNDGDLPDANGIPGNCIAIVVDGGDATTIINTIWAKKGGTGTYGSVRQIVRDAYGAQLSVAYFPVVEVQITVAITIQQLAAFTSDVVGQIQVAMASQINATNIGNKVQYNRLYSSAYLYGAAANHTFEVVSIAVARDGLTPTSADIAIAFYEAAACSPSNISVTVEPY